MQQTMLLLRFSLSKMNPENSLLGKLLTDYAFPIAPSLSNGIVRALNVSNCSALSGINLMAKSHQVTTAA